MMEHLISLHKDFLWAGGRSDANSRPDALRVLSAQLQSACYQGVLPFHSLKRNLKVLQGLVVCDSSVGQDESA